MLSAAPPPKKPRGFRAAGLAIPWPRSLRLGSASGSNVRARPRRGPRPQQRHPAFSGESLSRSDPLDEVAQRQEPLAGEREAVVGPQLAVLDEDVDLLLEGEELQDGERVALAVDRAQVVTGERQARARGEQKVVLAGVAGEERRGEVRARDREADAHVAAAVVAERRVDADVDRLAGVGERADPAADVDDLVAVEVDRVDRAHHAALRLLNVRGDRGLAERLGDDALEHLVAGLHPSPPL